MRTVQKNYEMDMCTGPVFGKMLKFTLVIFATSVLQQLFNTADLLVVGRFGKEGALASVGATSSLINLFINLFVGFSVGAGVVMAKHYGAKNRQEASNCLHTSVALGVLGGLFLAVVAFFLAPVVLKLLGTPEEKGILEGAVIYMRIYFFGMPFMLLYNFCASILRAVGDSRRTLYYITQAGVINVLLNLVFVIVLDMNVAGVALATTISQAYCAARCIHCFLNYDGYLKLNIKDITINKKSLLSIARVGIPSGLQGTLFSLSNVVITSSVNSFGQYAMSGSAAAHNIESYIYMAMNSISNTVTNFASQNFGAGKLDRIKRVGFIGMALSMGVGLVLGVSAVSVSKILVGFFTKNPKEIGFGITRLSIICGTYFVCGLMEVTTGLLRGVFKPLPAMIISIVGVCGLRMVWIYTIFAKFRQFWIIFLSYPISWFICFVLQGIVFVYCFKKLKKEFDLQHKKA